jgi:hypothetical protein
MNIFLRNEEVKFLFVFSVQLLGAKETRKNKKNEIKSKQQQHTEGIRVSQ